jgi:hypothetical protein
MPVGSTGGNLADPQTELKILMVLQPYSDHNGAICASDLTGVFL